MSLARVAPGMLLLAHLLAAQTGIITTIAGRASVRGFDGDNGPAAAAALALANLQNGCSDPNRFEQTSHIALDPKGNFYLADANNQRIRRIGPTGIIATIAGDGATPQVNTRCEPTSSPNDGPSALAAHFFNPADVLPLPNGALVIADQQNNRIRRIDPNGAITTIAGNGLHNLYAPGIPATSSPLDWPAALAADSTGAIYFSELHSNRIGKIGADGRLSTVAGTGFPGFNGDRAATAATLTKPAGIAFDKSGALLIADTGNHRIRRIDPGGNLVTIAGSTQGFCGDGGPAAQACLDTPMDVKADALGDIYIADTANHRVRRIDAAGMITTVAGTGIPDRGPDGVPGPSSALNFPNALAIDANNDVYIADWQNYLIRKLTFSGAPAVSAGGIVNAASFTAPVAPGSLISLFGVNFTEATAVEINGAPVPILGVFPAQINAQLPYEIAPGEAAAVVVTPAARSVPVSFQVAAASIGVFVTVNQDFTINTPATPEARGRVVTVYVTGLGTVTPPVPTGQLAPASLFTADAPVTATIGGIPAQVLFAGLTPGFIGLGQLNVLIPPDAPTGDTVPLQIQSAKVSTLAIR